MIGEHSRFTSHPLLKRGGGDFKRFASPKLTTAQGNRTNNINISNRSKEGNNASYLLDMSLNINASSGGQAALRKYRSVLDTNTSRHNNNNSCNLNTLQPQETTGKVAAVTSKNGKLMASK